MIRKQQSQAERTSVSVRVESSGVEWKRGGEGGGERAKGWMGDG